MIFEDKTRNRWKWTALVFTILMLSASAILIVWIDSLVSNPTLPGITKLKDSIGCRLHHSRGQY